MIKFKTEDENDELYHSQVIRGGGQKRQRADPERFRTNISHESLSECEGERNGVGVYERNFVGKTWFEEINNKYLPNLIMIHDGVVDEAKHHHLEMSGLSKGSIEMLKAIENICKTWNTILEVPNVPNREEKLTYEILGDPNHPVVQLILYLYTLDCFLYPSLNKGLQI